MITICLLMASETEQTHPLSSTPRDKRARLAGASSVLFNGCSIMEGRVEGGRKREPPSRGHVTLCSVFLIGR